MRLALKAQSQCRTTLETLANIKNPPAVFARQANIAHGPQQVNNGVPASGSRARETQNRQTNYQGAAMSYYRTAEHRELRAELIGKWNPWEKSTGPKSAAGKARSARNAYKGATREILRELRRALRDQDESRQAVWE